MERVVQIAWSLVALLMIWAIVPPAVMVWRRQGMAVQKRLHVIGLAILVAGLVAAALISRKLPPEDRGKVIGYTVERGQAYPVYARDSKSYQNASAQFFGRSNEEVARFKEWFVGLWQGRRLASTLVFVSIGACLGCFCLARFLE